MSQDYLWWQKGVIYQIYPRSYQDSNADGVGDIPGIIQRLDYLESLNVDAVWLSPIYPSPMHDFGYDVADYIGINPLFGTMADFDNLLTGLHQRGMKLLIDLVPNHSSDEHAWFIESRSSRDNPKRDWYVWRDPAPDGGPPNNWASFFGGPAWTFDEKTRQYYLHQFVTQQPELNYENPAVMAAMLDNMRFWLDKGVDGFRVDVIWLMKKDQRFLDEPPNPDWDGVHPSRKTLKIFTKNVPGVHELIKQMRGVLDEYDQRMMVGEIYEPFDILAEYYGENMDECHMPFNFHLIMSEWKAGTVQRVVEEYEAALPENGWPNWVLGNHDQHRIASRVGPGQARVANMLLLTLRGTPTSYYGEELGMENVAIPPEFVQDPPAVNMPELAAEIGRDPERTPMQWSAAPNAGFSPEGVTTWLPVSEKYKQVNVAVETQDPTAMLSLYRALTTLRRAEPALHIGAYQTVETEVDDILAYTRTSPDGDDFLVVLNFGGGTYTLDLSAIAASAQIAVATGMQRSGEVSLAGLVIGADEGVVLQLPK